MQISDIELKKVMQMGGLRLTDPIEGEEPSPRPTDGPLIKALTKEIIEMPDREDRIAEVRAKLETGNYRPAADEIAEAMIRRAIADRLKVD